VGFFQYRQNTFDHCRVDLLFSEDFSRAELKKKFSAYNPIKLDRLF